MSKLEAAAKTAYVWRAALALLAYWSLLLIFEVGGFGLVGLLILGLPLFLSVSGHLHQAEGRARAAPSAPGVSDREAFRREARRRLGNAKPGSLALLLLEVYGLAERNEACSWMAGDELLRAAAEHLDRAQASFHRIGGNRFALLVDRLGGQGVSRIMRQLEPLDLAFASCRHEHRLCFSFGYASNLPGETLQRLLSRAEGRLRQYKQRRYQRGELPERRQEPAAPAKAPIASLDELRRRSAERARQSFG